MNPPKITAREIRAMKGTGRRIASLTAYDFASTRLLNEAGIPFVHVGDTVGLTAV